MKVLYSITFLCIIFYQACRGEINIEAEPTQHLNASSDGLIICQTTGSPAPTISWTFNGTRIRTNDVKYALLESGLLVRGVRNEDAGVYECQAQQMELGSFAVARITVQVQSLQVNTAPRPQGKVVRRLGSSLVLSCQSISGDVDSLRWLDKNGNTVDNSSRRISTTKWGNTKILMLMNITEEDAGIYTCDQAGLNTTFHLSIFRDINIEADPLQHLNASTDGLVRCRATGFPNPTVFWNFNRTRIRSDDAKYVIREDGLLVREVRQEDSGVYECRAQMMELGSINVAMVTVQVRFPAVNRRPMLIAPRGNVIRPIGSSLAVPCETTNGDVHSLTWFNVHGNPVNNSTRKMSTSTSGHTKTLYLREITEEDAGMYTCDQAGLNTTFQLSLFRDIKIEADPLQHLNASTNGLVRCRATGIPSPTISWYFNRTRIHSDDAKYTLREDGLLVRGVSQEDAGVYECRAEVMEDGRLDVARITVQV